MRFPRKLGRRLKTVEYWMTAQVLFALFTLLRCLPFRGALDFAEWVARGAGPKLGRHRLALNNLRYAYPEKSAAEIEEIASDMWANMARLAIEYLFLDRLFDLDAEGAQSRRVELVGAEIFRRARDEGRPHIFFTAHLGNFELLPMAAATFGLNITTLFRHPNNPYIASYIHKVRSSSMGSLLPSRSGAALQLASILAKGGNIGALVDQKFTRGIRTEFFGRECSTSPLVPKLTRQYDCDVYPARCIRLSEERFRLEIGEKLDVPRDPDGVVDVQRMAQQLNDIVETWVRADPGQWMWFHRRWEIR